MKNNILIISGIAVAVIFLGLFLSMYASPPMGPQPPPGNFGQLPQPVIQTGSTIKNCTLTPSLVEIESTPQQTEGPYFVEEMLDRSDIRSDPSDGSEQNGIPLHLVIYVYDSDNGTCTPLRGAQVDIWHANSHGLYSDIQSINTQGKKYLRGYQITDDNGKVGFTTIYPGWYEGRALHIHIKVRTFEGTQKTFEWTSQFYLDDSITEQVESQSPYSSHGPTKIKNEQDGIFNGPSTDGMIISDTGKHLMLDLTGNNSGYVGTFNIVVNSGQAGK